MTRDASEPMPDDVATLRAMLLERERELQALSNQVESQTKTIVEIERNRETLAATAELQSQTIAEQARRQEQLEHRIAQLLKQLYGRKSERFVDPDQLLLFDEDDLKALEQEQRDRLREEKLAERQAKKPDAKPKRPGHGRREMPDHLPREVVRLEIPQDQRACPGCGQERVEIGCESSEQLEYVPAKLEVFVHVRPKYACSKCRDGVASPPVPPKVVPRGIAGPGLVSYVLVSKFADHLPLYRLEDILFRHGLSIARSTLCDWVRNAAELLEPLAALQKARILASDVLWTDDTHVTALDPNAPGGSKKARFWVYSAAPPRPTACTTSR